MKKRVVTVMIVMSYSLHAVTFNVINKMPVTSAHINVEHVGCGSQDYYFAPNSSTEFAPKTVKASLLSKEKSCYVKKLLYVQDGKQPQLLATDQSLNELGKKNGSGDNCHGYFTLTIEADGSAFLR